MDIQSTYQDELSNAVSRMKDDGMNILHWVNSIRFCTTNDQRLELLSNIERTSEKLERYSRELIKELQLIE